MLFTEILPRIAEYLRYELAKEQLSARAERTRLYYVERIDATLSENGHNEGGVGRGACAGTVRNKNNNNVQQDERLCNTKSVTSGRVISDSAEKLVFHSVSLMRQSRGTLSAIGWQDTALARQPNEISVY